MDHQMEYQTYAQKHASSQQVQRITPEQQRSSNTTCEQDEYGENTAAANSDQTLDEDGISCPPILSLGIYNRECGTNHNFSLDSIPLRTMERRVPKTPIKV
ncbi:uncharacterized protein ACN427_004616 [Glossina fuscipes fuscipes]